MKKSGAVKRAFSAVTAAAFVCGGAAAVIMTEQPASAGAWDGIYSSEHYEYRLDDYDMALLCGYFGSDTELVIPETIDGHKVVSIEDKCFYENNKIKSVTVPKNVSEIGAEAFCRCTSLESVTLPAGLEILEEKVFYGSGLKTAAIPSGVKVIPYKAFAECGSLASVRLSSGISQLSSSAFENCVSLTTFKMPENVSYVGEKCFYGCKSLAAVKLDAKYTELPKNCFGLCSSLTSVALPSKLTRIGAYAFDRCTGLSVVKVNNSLNTIEDYAFIDCDSLEEITLPSSVNVISDTAFGCYRSDPFWKIEKTDDLLINAPGGSAAHLYAEKKGFSFNDTAVVKATGITLNKTLVSVNKGSFFTLTPTITPSNTTNKTVTWTSSDTRIASVSAGKVTAIAPGTAEIRAETSNGLSAVCKFTVKDPEIYAQSITLSKTSVSLGKGETYSLSAAVAPDNTTNKAVTWTSSNAGVASVSAGSIRALGTGTAVINGRTSNGRTASCTVTVKSAPAAVTLSKGVLTIGVGEKYSFTSTMNDGAACSKRTYRTSNSSIVKMTRTDWQGDFVGVKPGVAYVTVRTYNGKEATCKVTVKAAPTSVTISKKNLSLKVGQTSTLSCSIPSGAGCASRVYRTSNSSIVKMTKTSWTGEFKAVKAGVAWVTVRTYNGKESSCKITVI